MDNHTLKQKLIQRINSIESNKLLNEIYKLLETTNEESFYELSESQIAIISDAQQEYKTNEILSQEEAEKEIEKWLGK